MPNLPHNHHSSVGSLRTYLESILPTSQLSEVTLDPTHQPVLLMQTKYFIAAFAFSGMDLCNSYDALYGAFKNYYARQQGQWDSLDLAFVFCVQPSMPNLDHFCSKIETDVYFCRKFVVILETPLVASLARLPFLPLMSRNGQSMRPASAQTFLQQCTVPAMLAKYIVVQRERSPQGIVEDCTSGKFGEPRELALATSSRFVQSDREEGDPGRLKTVTITNFRAYRKPQAFEIGSNVTVLYGPNGFGKTSFFDAVDFAFTGGIGRFESSNEALFAKTAQHLDSKSEESSVSISYQRNGTVRQVTRSVSARKQALLDGQPADRKSILSELTSGTIPAADRVENFVSLFRATHLFSQEQQELTRDFQQDCRLSAEIVSRMLAFEDYVNAVNKTAKVREVLQDVIKTANDEIKNLSEQVTDEKKELERLGLMAKTHANIDVLDAEIEVLRAKIIAAGIPVPIKKVDVAIVRGWRASLEGRHAESQTRIDRLSTLTKETNELRRMHTELAGLMQQLAQKERELSAADEKRLAAEPAIHRAEKCLAEMNAKCTETQAYSELLEWVRATKPLYTLLVDKQHSLNDELVRATESLEQYRTTEEKEASGLRALQNLTKSTSEKLAAKRAEHAAVQNLIESISSWQANCARLTSVVESEQFSIQSLESLQVEESELSLQVTAVAAEEARLSRIIAEVDKNQSEFKNLLSQLQAHVRTGTCPLCGEDHGSKDELISRIQKHFNTDAASDARVELTNVLERAQKLSERVSNNKQKQRAAASQLTDLKKERARLDAEITQFSSAAVNFRIVPDESSTYPREQLQKRLKGVNQEIEELSQKVQETAVAEEEARTSLVNTRGLIEALMAKVADQKSALTQLQEDVSRLRSELGLTQLSLDVDDKQLLELERLNRLNLAEFKTEMATAQAETVKRKNEISALRQEIASLKTKISALRTEVANVQKTMTQITARLVESNLPADADEEMLVSLIKEESRAQAQISLLLESTSNLELAIDAATTAAAHTKLLKNIRNKEEAILAAEQRRNHHQPWLKYFDELSRLLSSHQNEAIANFTREFGPLTSVIQRRLRSVYGFDDIEIQSHESMISVRVKRHGEELRPTDYFSQSQQQTLLLGLFLTACSSQTWSAFSTVFLDDPVTHFDDLNTYALLDLIVGLLETGFGNRQFIISTCDEKLLQLARQKFRHFGEGAKFYRFSAIGADGPIVNEIN